MTPLEKARKNSGRVNYCDECEKFQIIGSAAYCKVDGKLIHPIMLVRGGQGTGPAWNCKKRIKPITNYDLLIHKTPEEMAEWVAERSTAPNCTGKCHKDYEVYGELRTFCHDCWLDWLKKEVDE